VVRGADIGVREEIKAYIGSQPEPKASDMQALHRLMLKLMPRCRN
jgi:hypothetical protein